VGMQLEVYVNLAHGHEFTELTGSCGYLNFYKLEVGLELRQFDTVNSQ
jgi:hypothetical protein